MSAKGGDKVVPLKSGPDPAIAELLEQRNAMGLRLSDKKKPIACLENAVLVLEKLEEWQGVLAWNEFSLSLEKLRAPPFGSTAGEWTDADDDELDLWLSQVYDMRVGRTDCARAAGLVARRNAFHPVRSYLDELRWDGQERLHTWLTRFLGAYAPEGDLRSVGYYAKAGTWWLISAVARIYSPGCQADHVLLLEGKQGIGKSSALRVLFGDGHSDTPLQIGNKDSYGNLRGVWCYELAEIDSLNRAESSASKAFFTSRRDKYRPPYGERDVIVPRQVVFAGTVNHDQYLRDSTGNRRYWPVRCGEMQLRGADGLEAYVGHLFAEAKHRFQAGELWHPITDEDKQLFGEQQEEREIGDVYEDLIEFGTRGKTEITMAQILGDILKIDPGKMTRAEQMRVGEAMRKLGWKRKRQSNGTRSYFYVRDEPNVVRAEGRPVDDIPF